MPRLAARKFDAAIARRLARYIEAVKDATGFAEVGDRIIDCETGASLLERVLVAQVKESWKLTRPGYRAHSGS